MLVSMATSFCQRGRCSVRIIDLQSMRAPVSTHELQVMVGWCKFKPALNATGF